MMHFDVKVNHETIAEVVITNRGRPSGDGPDDTRIYTWACHPHYRPTHRTEGTVTHRRYDGWAPLIREVMEDMTR